MSRSRNHNRRWCAQALLAVSALLPGCLTAQADTVSRAVIRGTLLGSAGFLLRRPTRTALDDADIETIHVLLESQAESVLVRVTADSVRTRRLAELTQAKARWAARRPKAYRLTGSIGCLCFAAIGRPLKLEFRGDTLASALNSSGSRVTRPPYWTARFSASALFATADDAIRNVEIFLVRIEYDPIYGLPTLIDTDAARVMTDGYFRVQVRDFAVIRP